MQTKHKKQAIYFLTLVLSLSFVSAGLESFVDSLTFNYNNNTINITNFSDILIDSDSNGVNDTLKLTLTTSGTAGQYLFIGSLEDQYGIVSSTVNETVSASDNVEINFSTSLFSQDQYNYSVRIFNGNNHLVYRKDKTETSLLENYEQGISINSFSDQNIGNDLIRITLNLNVTDNQTSNVTVFLRFNNSIISSTKEATLTTPSQSVDIDFDNETIKGTHYNSNFTVDYVTIGEKTIDTNYNTSVYDYEIFAKTSYFKLFNDSKYDLDSNNISKYLQLNFTINFKSTGTYIIESNLYDLYGNYITNVSKTQSIGSTGIQSVLININGTSIYSSKIDGPYLLQFVKLVKSGETIDFISEHYTTGVYYYDDFERPPMPDLTLTINTSFSGANNETNITLNVTNQGESPAFNIFVDVFDNNTYENQSSTAYLNINESKVFNFLAPNTTNDSIFTSIVDFDNYVDESNESNNIVNNIESLISILSLSSIYSSNNLYVFQFIILNNGDTALTNLNWTMDFGDGNNTYSIYPFNLTSSEDILVFVEHQYQDNESYTVTANAYAGDLSASKQTSVGGESDLQITSFTELYSMGREKVWQFFIQNNGESNITDIYWNITGTNNPISSIYPINLTVNESIVVYVQENLSNYQIYTITAKAFTDSQSNTETLSTRGKELEVSNIKTLYTNGLIKTFDFLITNTYTSAINNLNWSFYTGEETIDSIYPFNLTALENIQVIMENQYQNYGNYSINVSARSSQYDDWENKSITV